MTAKVEIINGNGVVEVDIDGQVSENVDIDAANIEVLETNVGGLSTIFGASDTNFDSLADKDALFYDIATGKWINSPAYFEYIKTQNFIGLPVHMETLQQWIDHIYSSGRVHGLELTDNLDGTVDIASGVAIMRAVDDPHTALYSVNIDGVSDLALTNNKTNFVYAEYDATTPVISVTLNPGDINLTTKVPLFVIVREDTHLSIYDVGEDSVDSNASLRKRFFYTEKFRRADGGAIIYDAGALHIGCTAGEFYFGLTSFTFDALDTNGADVFEYYRLINGSWIMTDESTVSNTEYNDISISGSESLVSLGASKYAVHWVYLIGSTTNPHFAVVYSQDFYSNLAGAEAATVPSSIPPSIEGLGILLGRVIARQGDSEIISTDSSFTETFSSSFATSHNGLADLQGGTLNEYYHLTAAEYTALQGGHLKTDGSNQMDAALDFSAGKLQFDDNGNPMFRTAYSANVVRWIAANNSNLFTETLKIEAGGFAGKVILCDSLGFFTFDGFAGSMQYSGTAYSLGNSVNNDLLKLNISQVEPGVDDSYDLGHTTKRWRALHISGRAYFGVPDSAPNDVDISSSSASFYLDETANEIKIRVKYADGTTLKTGAISLT